MIKIGITGLTDDEKNFCAHGTTNTHARRLIFARGVGGDIWAGHVRVNNQEIDFEMHVVKSREEQGVFAYTKSCDAYVLLVDKHRFKKEKLEALIANILTFEKKTLETCPFTIVLTDKNSSEEVKQFAESKGIPFAYFHIPGGISLPGRPPIEDQSGPVNNVLAPLVGRVLPLLGTDRILKAPAKPLGLY